MTQRGWHKAAIEQHELKCPFREALDRYFKYRILRKAKRRVKQPYTLKELKEMQGKINKLRLIAGLPRIRYLQETLELLKTK